MTLIYIKKDDSSVILSYTNYIIVTIDQILKSIINLKLAYPLTSLTSIRIRTSRGLFQRAKHRSFYCYRMRVFFLTYTRNVLVGDMNATSAFLFFDCAHVLESLEIIFGTLLDQGQIRSPSAIIIQHQSFDRTFGIPRMAPSFSRDVHSHFLSLSLSFFYSSPSLSGSYSPSTFPVQPPLVYMCAWK